MSWEEGGFAWPIIRDPAYQHTCKRTTVIIPPYHIFDLKRRTILAEVTQALGKISSNWLHMVECVGFHNRTIIDDFTYRQIWTSLSLANLHGWRDSNIYTWKRCWINNKSNTWHLRVLLSLITLPVHPNDVLATKISNIFRQRVGAQNCILLHPRTTPFKSYYSLE